MASNSFAFSSYKTTAKARASLRVSKSVKEYPFCLRICAGMRYLSLLANSSCCW